MCNTPFLDHCLYTIMVGSAYFVKSTPPRAFSVSFKFFVDLFQIYFRCARIIFMLKIKFLTNLQLLFNLTNFLPFLMINNDHSAYSEINLKLSIYSFNIL